MSITRSDDALPPRSGPGTLPPASTLRAIAELRGQVAWVIDCATGLPTYISPSVDCVIGYSFADLQRQLAYNAAGTPLYQLCSGLAERLKRYHAGDLSRLHLVRQFEQLCGDGCVVSVEVVSTLLCDADGKAHTLAGVLRDVSAEREQAAGQRRFASMLNHEFRTPLSTIDGAVQRLEATSAHADQATRQRYRKISVAVDRLIEMLDTYLSPDRLATIGRTRPPNSVAPASLLEQGAEMARAAGRQVTLDVANLPGAMRCSPDGMQLAIRVLVENAIQYSVPRSVISLSGRHADGGLELLVRNEGEGIPAADLPRIFEKGYRGSNAGSRPGSGLGLYMASSVVEVHGGTLTARSIGRSGAEFRLWLPAP